MEMSQSKTTTVHSTTTITLKWSDLREILERAKIKLEGSEVYIRVKEFPEIPSPFFPQEDFDLITIQIKTTETELPDFDPTECEDKLPDEEEPWPFELNYFVRTAGGKVGIVSALHRYRGVQIQFGPDGPYRYYSPANLSYATWEEVKDAGLMGASGIIKGR